MNKIDLSMSVWLGTEEAIDESMLAEFQAHQMLVVDPSLRLQAKSSNSAEKSRFGDYEEYIQVVHNVAVVPIHGAMRSKSNWMTDLMQIMTYDTLANIMATLVADKGIDTVLLDIDSPGGQAANIDVAGDAIKEAQNAGLKVVAHTSGRAMSAAYWLGSAASEFNATKSAEVGSVGVIGLHMEESERNDMKGIKFTVLRKGENKALATPYEKLTDKARAQIEASMDRAYQRFVSVVSENRGIPYDTVLKKIATGDEFGSAEALALGMIDKVISYNDMVSGLVKADKAGAAGAGNSDWSKAAMHKQPIIQAGKMTPEEAAIAVAAGADPEKVKPLVTPEASAEDSSHEELAEVEVLEEGAEAASEEHESKAESNGKAAPASSDQAVYQGMIDSLNEKLIEARLQVKTMEAEITTLKAGNAGLRQIAVEQTQRLRIGLGMPADVADLELMSDAALVTSHRSVLKQFFDRFNVGQTSRSPEQDNAPSATVTRLHNAAKAATRLK